MKVPVRRLPQTHISEQQQGFARAVQPLDVSSVTKPINETVRGFREQLQDEQLDRQKFDASKRLMQEINFDQADFEERRRNPEISPVDFADTTKAAYEARHQAIIEELRGEGYDREVLQDLDLRLGTVRQGFYERGLGHQLAEQKSRDLNEADELGSHISQYVGANSDNYASGETMLRESISRLPGLTGAEKEAKINEQLGILRDAGGKRLVIERPQYIIDLLDPQGLTAPYRAAATGATISLEGLDADRSAVAATLSSGGLSPAVVAGFLGNFDVEGGYSGIQGDGGSASGIAQLRGERRDNFRNRFGKDPHQATKEEQAQFVLWELANPAAAGMTAAQVSAIRNADTAEEAAELIDKFYERSSGEHRSRRKAAAAGYARTEINPAPESEAVATSTLAPMAPDAQTGNALLDDMNGPERLQLLGWAREQLNKVGASRKAEMDVTIGNITAAALNNGGEIAAPLPVEADVISVYGPVEGPQRWAQIQQSKATGKVITTFRTQSAETIQRGLDAIEPKPDSRTYETEMQIYQSAERARDHLLKEREDDPATYALTYFPSVRSALNKGMPNYYAELDRVYETLGIDSDRAPLLSADATRQIVGDYKLMSPPEKLKFMVENFSGMGEDRFRRFVSNMEGTTAQEDARIFALFRSYPRPNGEWALTIQQVLEGREIMAKDPARRPSAEVINKQFRVEGLTAVTNLNADASAAIQESAAALYVMRGGNPDPLKFNKTLYKGALATALGGSLPIFDGKGKVTDYTILPPRTNKTQFQQWTERQTFESLTELSVEKRPPRYGDLKTLVQTEDLIDDGVFVMVSPGRYMIKMASDNKPVMTSKGRPFLVNISSRDINASPITRRPDLETRTNPFATGGR